MPFLPLSCFTVILSLLSYCPYVILFLPVSCSYPYLVFSLPLYCFYRYLVLTVIFPYRFLVLAGILSLPLFCLYRYLVFTAILYLPFSCTYHYPVRALIVYYRTIYLLLHTFVNVFGEREKIDCWRLLLSYWIDVANSSVYCCNHLIQ